MGCGALNGVWGDGGKAKLCVSCREVCRFAVKGLVKELCNGNGNGNGKGRRGAGELKIRSLN